MDNAKALLVYTSEVIVIFKNNYRINFYDLPVSKKTITTAFNQKQSPDEFCRLIAASFCLQPVTTKEKI